MSDSENSKTVWNFYPEKAIAGVTHIPLEENIVFSPESFSFLFNAYRTGYGLNATVWGKKVGLELSIATFDMPREASAEDLETSRRAAMADTLPEDKQQAIKKLREKCDELKAKLPPPADDELENRYWEFINPESFVAPFKKAITIWNDKMTSRADKCRAVGAPLSEMYCALKDLKLPEELMRDDTQFTVMLAKIMQFSKNAGDYAEKNGIEIHPDVRQLAEWTDKMTDRMIEGGNKLYGIPRDMTKEEYNDYSDMKLVALYSDKPAKERLPLLETLSDYRLADFDDRISFIEKAIELTLEEAIPCPDEQLISRHLGVADACIKELEKAGEDYWRKMVADSLAGAAKEKWEAEEKPVLSKEEWAPRIHLHSVVVETKEQIEGDPDYTVKLRFLDENRTFGGRTIEASIVNGILKDIGAA